MGLGKSHDSYHFSSTYCVPETLPRAQHTIIPNFQNNFVRSELYINICILQVRKLKLGEVKVAQLVRIRAGMGEVVQQLSKCDLWTPHHV